MQRCAEWFIVLPPFKFASEAPWWKKVVMDAGSETSKTTLTTWNGNLCLFTNDLKICYFLVEEKTS